MSKLIEMIYTLAEVETAAPNLNGCMCHPKNTRQPSLRWKKWWSLEIVHMKKLRCSLLMCICVLFLSDDFSERIVQKTNRYTEQEIAAARITCISRSRLVSWKLTHREEIKIKLWHYNLHD